MALFGSINTDNDHNNTILNDDIESKYIMLLTDVVIVW